MTGGTGSYSVLCGAGNDNLTGGDGGDAMNGGTGNNTYTYTAINTADSGETITFNTTVGATETIAVTAGAGIAMDLTAVNGGALLTGLDAVTMAAADDVTFLASQVTGLTIAATGTGGAVENLTVNGATGTVDDTIDLSNVTLTNAAVVVSAGAGADTVTANAGGGSFTLGAGADTFTAGAGADVVVVGNTDSGITVATADTITSFTTGADTLSLGVVGVLVNAGGGTTAENYTEAAAAVADFAAAFTAANTAIAAANVTETTATVFYNLQYDATNGYLFEDTDADGDADQVMILTGITDATLAPGDIVA
jgi:Ca2+-binding RTX toxin-like protein